MAAGIDPRASFLHCGCCARCRCPRLQAHYFFVLCDAQACDLMDEAICVLVTTEGQLDASN